MEKTLRIDHVQKRLAERGMNQSSVAKQLGLSRAAVSKWFTGSAFPRPAELLKLGKLLELGFKDLVQTRETAPAPLVAFRKRAGTKTTDCHIEQAREMGRLLESLVPYLGFDQFETPPRLKKPVLDHDYIQELVRKVRLELNLDPVKPIDFKDLIGRFSQLQAVLVPVMWGRKSGHANALHIYLPGSQTTWVLVNLDSELHDFKFWMAHELGHVLTIDLLRENKIDEAEDFADALAGALLFPEPLAKDAYTEYKTCRTEPSRLKVLGKWAEEHMISPFSVYKEIGKYAGVSGFPFAPVEDRVLHAFIASFNKRYQTLGEYFFDGKIPTADHFMRIVQDAFGTKVYSALSQYVREKEPGAGAVATILGVNRMDARGYLEAFLV